MPARRVLLLFNPVSGAGRAARLAEAARQALAAAGHDVLAKATERTAPESAGTIPAWLSEALVDREVAVVVGGDGAVRLTVDAIARAGAALWHCPAGTENLFARAFGMVADPRHLLAALERWDLHPIDLGSFTVLDAAAVDGPRAAPATFTIMASIGFDAHVIHDLTLHRRGAITHLSYVPAIARTLRRWRPVEVSVAIDGGMPETLGRGVLIVGNLGEYAFRIDPVRVAKPDDGLLDAVFLPASTGLAALAWGPRFILTRSLLGREVVGLRRFQATTVRVVTATPTLWQADGDPAGPTADAAGAGGTGAVEIGIRRGAVRVLRPPSW